MPRSPLSRNRRFERFALPILLVLFAVVGVRQLQGLVWPAPQACAERSRHEARHPHEARPHGERHHRPGRPRHDRRERRAEREVVIVTENR